METHRVATMIITICVMTGALVTYNPVEQLFDTKAHADVIFVVDNEEIPGHRLIISAVVPYFEKEFYGNWKERTSEKVEIKETSPKAFKEMMRFIYKGQMQVDDWTIKDLLNLTVLANRYWFQQLFNTTLEILHNRPLDFESWTIVNEWAHLLNLTRMQEKCSAFAEAKIADFLVQKDLHQFTAEFICSMFQLPQVSTCNPNQLLISLFTWKKDQSPKEIICVFQKICWEKVSPSVTAIIVRELFEASPNLDQCQFWDRGLQLLIEAVGLFAKVEMVTLKRNVTSKLLLEEDKGFLQLRLIKDNLKFEFVTDSASVELKVQKLEFESSTAFNKAEIYATDLNYHKVKMVASPATANNGWFKYCVSSDKTPVIMIVINSKSLKNMDEISLRNIKIY